MKPDRSSFALAEQQADRMFDALEVVDPMGRLHVNRQHVREWLVIQIAKRAAQIVAGSANATQD